MAETLFFNALREAIDEEMARDSAVFVLGEKTVTTVALIKLPRPIQKYGNEGLDTRLPKIALLAWRLEPR